MFKLELRGFILATLIGSLLWNTPFLCLGFLLYGSGYDPITLGLAVAVSLIAAEFAIVWILRRTRRGDAR